MILYYFFPAYISQTYVPIVFYYCQIGEWFYVAPGEEIAIFSAEHDKFVKISYAKALENDVREHTKLTKLLDNNTDTASSAVSTLLLRALVNAIRVWQGDKTDVPKINAVRDARNALLKEEDSGKIGKISSADSTAIKKDLGVGCPILIFRPFQTVRCCFSSLLLHALFLLALTESSQLLYYTQWTMASCILVKAGSELGNTFRK